MEDYMQNLNQKCRSLFLIDDTRDYTNNFYIFELVKVILFEEGAFTVSLSDICRKIEELTDMQYTEDEVTRAISFMNNNIVEISGDEYSLTPNGEEMMKRRKQVVSIDPFVRQYLSESKGAYETNEQEAIDSIYKFIYDKFNESISQISGILNRNFDFELSQEKYSETENKFINGFLNWNNEEKNKLVYTLIAKSFDYCMINAKCDNSEIDFSNFVFYVDTNIVFRLMGLNNEIRKNSIESFINKCKECGIHITVSNFVINECDATLDAQLQALINKTIKLNSLISPSSMSFAEEGSFGSDLYKIYYEWCKSGNKHKNYDAFSKYIKKELTKVLGNFEQNSSFISFEASDEKNFNPLFESLKKIKTDKHTAKTDVNSIMLINELRKETSNEVFLISADHILIRWISETFQTKKSIADLPSAWLAVLLKYSGREKTDDYKSFCQFIHLPVIPEPESDLLKKIEIKASIMSSDIEDCLKDQMIQDVKYNYPIYQNMDVEAAVHKAYAEVSEAIRDEEREKGRTIAENLLAEQKAILQKEFNDKLNAEVKRIDDEKENVFAKKIESAREESHENGITEGQESVLVSLAKSRVKKNKIWRWIITAVLIISCFVFIASLIISFLDNTKSSFYIFINNYSSIIELISFPISLCALLIKWSPGKLDLFSIDEKSNYNKLKARYEKNQKTSK